MVSVTSLKRRFLALRTRVWRVDHAVRAYGHFNQARGTQLAGAVTYFAFLSFFPLLAVAFAALGWVVVVHPDARVQVEQFLDENLPGLVGSGPGRLDVNVIADARAGAGLVGLAGLLYAGLGWLDALREALRQIYGLEPSERNIVVRKLLDVVMLAALGGGVLLTVTSSSLATAVTRQALDLVELERSTLAAALLKVLALLVSVGGDALLLTVVFARLPGHRLPWREVVRGALLGAVLLAILKLLGTWLVARMTANPVYGAFAVVVGLLVWLNFVCRVVLFAAAWSVTAARPVVAPTLAEQPLVEIPVIDPREVPLTRRRLASARLGALAGVSALVALRLGRSGGAPGR